VSDQLKAYVYDHGWDGAEVYFAYDKVAAMEYFRSRYMSVYQRHVDQHRPDHRPNPWVKYVEHYSSSLFDRDVVEYEPVSGMVIEIAGDS
jgi:hypothetical protein